MTFRCKAAVLRAIGLPQPYAQTRPLSIEEITQSELQVPDSL